MTGPGAAGGRGPLRVGFVIGQLTVGGAEGQLREVVRGLRGRIGAIVYCLHGTGGAVAADLAAAGAAVRVIGGARGARVRRLATALREDRVDLVHAWLFIANGYAWAACRLAARDGWRPPLVTSARNCKVQGLASRLVNAVAFRGSAAIVVNSRDVAAYVARAYAAPRARVHVVHNGVDTARFRPAATAAADAGPVITVGRLVVQKDHETFLRAAALLAAERPQQQFVIVGDGPLRGRLGERAAALGIAGRVTFAGERHDVEEWLRRASLFWLTSRWEGMPNVVLEAMATGLPSVVTAVGGTRELVRDGVEGFIVAPGDAGAIAARSRMLLDDAAARQRFGAAARARAEEFSVARMADALAALYTRVAGGGG